MMQVFCKSPVSHINLKRYSCTNLGKRLRLKILIVKVLCLLVAGACGRPAIYVWRGVAPNIFPSFFLMRLGNWVLFRGGGTGGAWGTSAHPIFLKIGEI